jgi:hypothetical protein
MDEYLFPQAEVNTFPPAEVNMFPPAGINAWPEPQQQERALADAEAFDRTAAVAGVIAVSGDTRRLSHISAGLLAAVLVGAATMGAALLVRGHPLALGSLGLLVPVLVCWLLAAALVLHSEGPVTSAFAELRRATGAPVNPYAPWVPVGLEPLADSQVTWDHVVPLIAAARRQHERARLALSVAILTTAAFLLWMVLSLAVAALA